MCDFAEDPLVPSLRASLFLIKDAMDSCLITSGIGIRSCITSRAVLGVLFVVLLSIPAANLLMELILFIIVFVVTALPKPDIHMLVSAEL